MFNSREQVEFVYSLFNFDVPIRSSGCFECVFRGESVESGLCCYLTIFNFDHQYLCPDSMQTRKLFPQKTKLNNILN